jgi:polyphosphate kinase
MTHADFLKAPFPEPVVLSAEETTGPRRFFNREISWLAFNWRVLEEAANPAVPLLERLRFLSISATNLDEFYTVRVAGLRALVKAGNATPSEDGLSPADQLTLIHADARDLMLMQQSVFKRLRRERGSAEETLEEALGTSDTRSSMPRYTPRSRETDIVVEEKRASDAGRGEAAGVGLGRGAR